MEIIYSKKMLIIFGLLNMVKKFLIQQDLDGEDKRDMMNIKHSWNIKIMCFIYNQHQYLIN